MPKYLLLLGNTPALSLAELHATLKQPIELLRTDVATVELESNDQAQQLSNVLGGVVKITKVVSELPLPQAPDLTPIISEVLSNIGQAENKTKITFSIGEIGRDHLPTVELSDIKNQLQELNFSSRYVESPRAGLSASVLLHHSNVIEILAIQTAEAIYLTQTVAVQDIDAWSARDRGKPYADRRKGMLPPKVARMMVNIGLGHHGQKPGQTLIYDPFCGSGTVLMEAAVLGTQLAGSDIDPDSVRGTQRNLSWLADEFGVNTQATVFVSDVTKAQPGQLPKPVDLIVTEPFLGKPTPRPEQLVGIFRGLEKMYWGAFRNWTHILANGATLVVILPLVEIGNQSFNLESLIDKLPGLGYTITSEPCVYRRPQAIVQRQIYTLTYQKV